MELKMLEHELQNFLERFTHLELNKLDMNFA